MCRRQCCICSTRGNMHPPHLDGTLEGAGSANTKKSTPCFAFFSMAPFSVYHHRLPCPWTPCPSGSPSRALFLLRCHCVLLKRRSMVVGGPCMLHAVLLISFTPHKETQRESRMSTNRMHALLLIGFTCHQGNPPKTHKATGKKGNSEEERERQQRGHPRSNLAQLMLKIA
jgi:hypothetical protein